MRICLFGDARSVHVQRLARGLAARGAHVHVVCHKPVDLPGVVVEQFRVPRPSLANPRRWHGRWERYVRGFLRRFDVVNIHFLNDWGFTPEMMRDGCVVASAWGSDIVPPPGEGHPSRELTAARVSLLRHADVVTTCGPTFARTVADFAGIDSDRIQVVSFGVDLELFKPLHTKSLQQDLRDGIPSRSGDVPEPRVSHPTGGHRVGFFKGFREVYGPADLIRAIPTVLDKLPETRFDLIGDGPELARCQRLASELRVAEAIEWIPRQPHREMPRWLAKWDLTVISSTCEAFGVAALESEAMGVPVVASNVGGLPDTVRDGETGLLVPANSPDAMAAAIVTLLSDAQRRRQMGRAAREWVSKHFDQRHVLDQWMDTFRKAVDCVTVLA